MSIDVTICPRYFLLARKYKTKTHTCTRHRLSCAMSDPASGICSTHKRRKKNITTNKFQQNSIDPDFIYLADKIKIDVVRLRFDSPTKQNTTAKLTSKTNIHRFRYFAWYICVVFDREEKKFNFHLYRNICLFCICFVCCLWHALRNRKMWDEFWFFVLVDFYFFSRDFKFAQNWITWFEDERKQLKVIRFLLFRSFDHKFSRLLCKMH